MRPMNLAGGTMTIHSVDDVVDKHQVADWKLTCHECGMWEATQEMTKYEVRKLMRDRGWEIHHGILLCNKCSEIEWLYKQERRIEQDKEMEAWARRKKNWYSKPWWKATIDKWLGKWDDEKGEWRE